MLTSFGSYTDLDGLHDQGVIRVTNTTFGDVVVRVSKVGHTTQPFVTISPGATHIFEDRDSYEIIWVAQANVTQPGAVLISIGRAGTQFNLNPT